MQHPVLHRRGHAEISEQFGVAPSVAAVVVGQKFTVRLRERVKCEVVPSAALCITWTLRITLCAHSGMRLVLQPRTDPRASPGYKACSSLVRHVFYFSRVFVKFSSLLPHASSLPSTYARQCSWRLKLSRAFFNAVMRHTFFSLSCMPCCALVSFGIMRRCSLADRVRERSCCGIFARGTCYTS